MIITVLGKQHMEGFSKKTGNPYNFNVIHYVGKNRFVTGSAALSVKISNEMIPFDQIVVGGKLEIEYGPNGVEDACVVE